MLNRVYIQKFEILEGFRRFVFLENLIMKVEAPSNEPTNCFFNFSSYGFVAHTG